MKLGQHKHRKIFGFIHTATFGNWREILDEQLFKIKQSGLYDQTQRITIGKLGDQDLSLNDPKIQIVSNPDVAVAEGFTLSMLQRMCREKPESFVWYIHTKGISRSPEEQGPVKHWRRAMEHFLIYRHEDCITALENHDIAGLFWWPYTYKEHIGPHFSGNFWWATSYYINTLDEVMSWAENNFPLQPEKRSRYEFWIGSNPAAKAKVLHEEPYEEGGPWLYDYELKFESYGKYLL